MEGQRTTNSNGRNGMKVKKREDEGCDDCGADGTEEFFKDEDLDQISELKRGNGYIEMRCGCTSPKYGDSVGRLKIYQQGDFKVICECSLGCTEGELSPSAFERHAGRENARKWKNNIWIIIGGQKVPLSKTMLLKYYSNGPRNSRGHAKGHNKQSCHRDEFVHCRKCNKERRFRLRSKEECRIYHDACRNPSWECADLPYDKITCQEDEERVSRKAHRGCPNVAACAGCTSCVCFGCSICRFSDCTCQTCVDFTSNSKA